MDQVEKPPEERPLKTVAAVAIPIDKSLELAPKDHTQLMAFIDRMIEARSVPRHLTNREQVLVAWNFAAQLRLPPQPSLRNIAMIEGTPSLFGDLPLALVQRHEDFVYYEEYNIDKDYNRICVENKNLDADAWGGVIFMQRRGMSEPKSYSFTIVDANRAGLIARAKAGMPWKTYPQTMLTRKARIAGIRAHFADALCGANIAEDFGYAPDLMKDVTPLDRAAELNARFTNGGTNVGSNLRSSGEADNQRRDAPGSEGPTDGVRTEV